MSKKHLTDDFVIELMKLCIKDKRVLETAAKHLKYQYLPSSEHKDLWKAILVHFDTLGKLPTVGILAQQYEHEPKVLQLISTLKKAEYPDKDTVFEQLENFVKNKMFLKVYDELGDLFNRNQKDEAYDLVQEAGGDLANFTIRESYYDKVFEDHQKRRVDRRTQIELEDVSGNKVPLSIPELDDLTRGGVDKGDTVLFLAQSGIGKTKALRHIGVGAARRGFKVAHIQAEGSRQECLDGYDATFTGIKMYELEKGLPIPEEKDTKIRKAVSHITSQGGEIYVEAFEQFDTATLADVRAMLIELQKAHGEMDMVLLDYFELFDPGDGKKYKVSEERQRREALANKLKNLALEFNVVMVSATQASTVQPDLLNDPEFVQTRYHISEFKGTIKPFSYFITMNQTKDEYRSKIMRLYVDKIRKYPGGRTVKIYQDYDYDRFCDVKRTRLEFYQSVED